MACFFQMLAVVEGTGATGDLAPTLLILSISFVVLVGMVFTFLICRHASSQRPVLRTRHDLDLNRGDRMAFQPVFDAPLRWIAIRGGNARMLQAALRLRNPRPCSWEEGLHRTLEHKVFISPLVHGWTLVMGPDLPDPSDDVDECFHFLTRLSRIVGEVQFFSVNRMFSHHAWVRLEHGKVRRAYAWCGQTVWNQGPVTEAERLLKLHLFDYLESPEKSYSSHLDPLGAATEKVTQLAARWSVDPTTVDFRSLRDNRGISGRFSPLNHPPR